MGGPKQFEKFAKEWKDAGEPESTVDGITEAMKDQGLPYSKMIWLNFGKLHKHYYPTSQSIQWDDEEAVYPWELLIDAIKEKCEMDPMVTDPIYWNKDENKWAKLEKKDWDWDTELKDWDWDTELSSSESE